MNPPTPPFLIPSLMLVKGADTEPKRKHALSRYISFEKGFGHGMGISFESIWGVSVATIREWAKREFESMLLGHPAYCDFHEWLIEHISSYISDYPVDPVQISFSTLKLWNPVTLSRLQRLPAYQVAIDQAPIHPCRSCNKRFFPLQLEAAKMSLLSPLLEPDEDFSAHMYSVEKHYVDLASCSGDIMVCTGCPRYIKDRKQRPPLSKIKLNFYKRSCKEPH